MNHIKLEEGLSVSHFGCLSQELDSLINVLVDTEALVVEDTHPVASNNVTLLGTGHVVLGGVDFVLGSNCSKLRVFLGLFTTC